MKSVAFLLGLACAFAPSPTFAQATRSGLTFSLGGTTAPTINPDVAYDSKDDQYLQVSGRPFIEGHIVSATGTLLRTFVVNDNGNYTQFPRVAYSPDVAGGAGGYLVTWHETVGSFSRVRGRIFKADLSAFTGSFDIAMNAISTATQSNWTMGAAVAYSTTSKEFLVTWQGNYGTTQDIFYQRVSITGTLLGATTAITFTNPDWERDPAVTYNSNADEFLIVYAAFNDRGGYAFVGAQRVKAGTGDVLGPALILGSALATYVPAVSYDTATRRYLVGWYNRTRAGAQVYGVLLNGADGSPASGVNVLSAFYSAYDALDIDYNVPSGEYLLVTHSNASEDAGVSIKSDGTAYDNGFVATNTPDFRAVRAGDGNFNPMIASSTREKKWLLVTASGFTSTAAQFLSTSGVGGGSHRATALDFLGTGKAQFSSYQAGTGGWNIQGAAVTPTWGHAGDIPLTADFDGDGMMDIVIYRPSTQEWWFKKSNTMIQYGRPGDLPVPADYDGDGKAEIAVFRPSTGEWYIRGNSATPVKWGIPADIPVPGDYNGDGKAEFAVFRRATGKWWIYGVGEIAYGARGDVPVPADYDGDGRTDIAVYRPSTGIWFVKDQFWRRFGAAGFVPVPMDVNGDGKADLVMFRSSTASWFVMDVGTNAITETVFGNPGDIPVGAALRTTSVFGDVDGDRRADPAIFRPATSEWFLQQSTGGAAVHFAFASAFDVPVAGDYDGDGKMDAAIWQPSTGMWYIRTSSSGFSTLITVGPWGLPTDVPMPADYDGDGKADVAVYRPSTGEWFFKQSSSDFTTTDYLTWGMPGDTPIAADFDGDGYADPAVFRPSEGMWYVNLRLAGSRSAYQWGMTGDTPLVGDFDGDGIGDRVVYRASQGLWFLQLSTGTTRTVQWGLATDIPVVADFDGDGRSDIVVYRPSTGRWYILNLITNTATAVDWGVIGDIPLLKR